MKPTLLASALVLAAVPGAFAQTTIAYRETFSSTTNNSNINLVGWTGHYGSGTVYNSGLNSLAVSNLTGRPASDTNVNAGSVTTTANTGGQVSTGFVFVAPQNAPLSGAATLVWTNEYTGTTPLTTSTVQDFSFHLANNITSSVVRVAVQVGSQWYVSSTAFGTTTAISGGNFGTQAQLRTLTFNPAASNWNTLTFAQAGTNPLTTNGTGSLTLGSVASSALSGTINAFGIYVNAGVTDNVRFDSFTITAIPEPSSFAALAGLGMLGFAATRRRRA